MLIILEGPDGTGKSTLAQVIYDKLVDRAKARTRVYLLHQGPPKLHPLDHYVTPLLRYRPNTDVHIVCDRWHWGEAVYPHILGRPTKLDDEVWRYTELFLQSRAAVVTYLDRPVNQLRATLIKRGDDLVQPKHIADIACLYDVVHSKYSNVYRNRIMMTPYFEHSDVNSLDFLATQIILTAETIEQRAFNSDVNDLVTYVGHSMPHILLIGDVRNGIDKMRHELAPAFGPYPATSGHYLMRSLLNTDLFNERLGIVNINDVDPASKLMTMLTPDSVVALGENAHRKLDELKWPHGAVPHPQYVRRFHHHMHDKYGEAIVRAATYGEDLRKWPPF